MTPMPIEAALTGVVSVLITPYKSGTAEVDMECCTALARRLDRAGIHAITALGNTAEAHQLDFAEQEQVLNSIASGRENACLIAGATGSRKNISRIGALAADLGYEALMLHEPPDPFGDAADLIDYYTRIADDAPLPIIVYARTPTIPATGLVALAKHSRIIGVKFARSDVRQLAQVLLIESRRSCAWVNGSAEAAIPMFVGLGITGFTSGIAVARPDLAMGIHRSLMQGATGEMQSLVSQLLPIEAMRNRRRNRNNVAVLKEMLRYYGIDTGGVRLPHAQLDDAERASLINSLKQLPELPGQLEF